MKNKKKWISLAVVMMMLVTLGLSGCGEPAAPPEDADTPTNGETEEPAGNGVEYPTGNIDMVAPSGAGGGWDLTIRTVAQVLDDTGLVDVSLPITNREGGGGAVQLGYMQEHADSDRLITVYSPPLLLINLNGSTEYSYQDTTPLARLITDYGAFMVAEDSHYESFTEVLDDIKEDPQSVIIGGGSATGSMDHIQFLIMAQAYGIEDLRAVEYVSFQDGSAPSQVLGGHIDVYSAGLSQVSGLIESGDLRVLAQTAGDRVGTGVMAEIPTCQEVGIDATFENWRGLFGPPNMPDHAAEFWRETLAEMVETDRWAQALETNAWDDAYLDGPEFETFLEETNESYKDILDAIGMLEN